MRVTTRPEVKAVLPLPMPLAYGPELRTQAHNPSTHRAVPAAAPLGEHGRIRSADGRPSRLPANGAGCWPKRIGGLHWGRPRPSGLGPWCTERVVRGGARDTGCTWRAKGVVPSRGWRWGCTAREAGRGGARGRGPKGVVAGGGPIAREAASPGVGVRREQGFGKLHWLACKCEAQVGYSMFAVMCCSMSGFAQVALS